jgi:glycogen phosphorylase
MLPTSKNPIAYFSLEFGIDSNIPTYAGGLGILAGDTMLEASELEIPMVGIGMMYKGRKFIQKISPEGWQFEEATPFRLDGASSFRRVEIAGSALRFQVQVGEEDVWVEAYRQRLGDNVTLFLLNADVDGNSDYWRNLFDEIYWGNDEEQIKERIFFGVGGVSLIEALKIKPSIYHFQEGRPSMASLALFASEYRKKPRPFEEILASVKSQIVYTNHTLVASGIHSYDMDIMRRYVAPYAKACETDVENILKLGAEDDGRFHTTRFALNISKLASGVSEPHTKMAKKRWASYNFVNVTNGVNLTRWQKREFASPMNTDSDIWKAHTAAKLSLEREVNARVGIGYDTSWFVATWARRISGYKQLDKLFEDTKLLKEAISQAGRPAMLLIAGKAHPGDSWGKELIKRIIDEMGTTLNGHAIFVHNYDIALSSMLVSGSDAWINIPEPDREASGTSGMKAVSNGVVQITAKEGWAYEVDWSGKGFVVDPTKAGESVANIIKDQALPLFYARDNDGLPKKWIEMMRNSISLSKKYNTERMLSEYIKKLYI